MYEKNSCNIHENFKAKSRGRKTGEKTKERKAEFVDRCASRKPFRISQGATKYLQVKCPPTPTFPKEIAYRHK